MSEAFEVTWFAPDRPTGGTVYARSTDVPRETESESEDA